MSREEWEQMMEGTDDDFFFESLRQQIEEDEGRTSIVNPMRLRDLAYTYHLVKENTNAAVSYKTNEPYPSMGSVSIEGKNLTFRKSDWFLKAVVLASNTDIYPKKNGRVVITFTFHGLTVPLE
ncbi:MAG: hypothetical protein IKY16_06790 [Bacteroidales bacterium]|nr:hypothetical protein [Bacteroidales bacterium]